MLATSQGIHPFMRGVRYLGDEIDDYYAANTRVHSLLAHDDAMRYPDGELIGDTTITRDEYFEKTLSMVG